MLQDSLIDKIDKHFPEKNIVILVSACLLGIDCTYNNQNHKDEHVIQLMKFRKLLPICPEQIGGLPTPREPQVIVKGSGKDVLKNKTQVINRKQIDVTNNFLKGANETSKIIQLFKVKYAIMKDRSPSCGVNFIYNKIEEDEKLIKGSGVTTAKLLENGLIIYSENDLKKILTE
ncbi:MAG: DUF523 domain-containing protein [Asgard group archaeon]|nr:DUF523 domain-containing protein [Asgard group archaeon]